MNSSSGCDHSVDVDCSDKVSELLENEALTLATLTAEEGSVSADSALFEQEVVRKESEEGLVANFQELEQPKCLETASASKEEGNKFFRDGEYDLALHSYTDAIEFCPKENSAELAVFYGNRAACYMSMKEFELAVEDCSEALQYNTSYVKVLIRRSQASERLEKYEDAIADAKAVQELEPDYPKIAVHIKRLERMHEQKMEEMKAEAMGKLKELGNSVLGFMGMKLDDFKFTQDPNTGSWNISTNPGDKPK